MLYGPTEAPWTIATDELESAGTTTPCLGTFVVRSRLTGRVERSLRTAATIVKFPFPFASGVWLRQLWGLSIMTES